MLTRQEVCREMEQANMRETAEKLFSLMLISVPRLKSSHEEYLAVAEHIIRNAFNRTAYKFAPSGPFLVFSEQLHLTKEDIALATERTKADFDSSEVEDVEIAITSAFLWLSQAVHEYGERVTEFMYLNYRIAEPCRHDEQLKDRGTQHLAEQIHKHPLAFLKTVLSFRQK